MKNFDLENVLTKSRCVFRTLSNIQDWVLTLTISTKRSILDVWQGSEYHSEKGPHRFSKQRNILRNKCFYCNTRRERIYWEKSKAPSQRQLRNPLTYSFSEVFLEIVGEIALSLTILWDILRTNTTSISN